MRPWYDISRVHHLDNTDHLTEEVTINKPWGHISALMLVKACIIEPSSWIDRTVDVGSLIIIVTGLFWIIATLLPPQSATQRSNGRPDTAAALIGSVSYEDDG